MNTVTVYPPYAMPHATEDRVSVKRVVLAMAGFALMVSAFGLWVAPVQDGEPSLYLMKLGLSLFMLLGGVAFLLSSRPLRRR